MTSTEILPLLIAERDKMNRAIDALGGTSQNTLIEQFIKANPYFARLKLDKLVNTGGDILISPAKSSVVDVTMHDSPSGLTQHLDTLIGKPNDKRRKWTPERKAAHSKRMAKYWKNQRKAS